MRHRKKRIKLNLSYDHRRALLKNLVRDLFVHGRITLSLARAKMISILAEKIINRAKRDPLAGRRYLFTFFNDKKLVNEIYEKVVLRFKDKNGGATRIKKLKRRIGDNTIVAILEFSDDKGGIRGTKEEEEKRKEEEKKEKKGKKKGGKKEEKKEDKNK